MQVLIVGYVWPEPASTAAGIRMVQLLKLLLQNNYKVTFATPTAPTAYIHDLHAMGIETRSIALNDESFDNFIRELAPNLVIFDRFMMEEQFGWRVARNCPDAIRILDTEDLHFLRSSREHKLSGKSSIRDSELEVREIASIYRCDLSMIISEVEMELLIQRYKVPPSLLLYLPFLYEKVTNPAEVLPSFESRKDFICIGNLKHAPNLDAVFYLKEKIWPLIHKQLPGAQMHIYGSYMPERIYRLHDPKTNFIINGRAESAADVVKQARVSLVPLRFGAGLKGKLTEAMVCGTPSVTTDIGAEGINGELPWNGTIANEPENFAAAAIGLYISPDRWEVAVQNGFKIINSRFTKDDFSPVFFERLNYVLKNLKDHRNENFTGRMLMHHRVKSTYYLSKYIETKTKLEIILTAKK